MPDVFTESQAHRTHRRLGHSAGSLPAADSERANRLFKAAIASLPDKQRIVFNLKYFDEMKYEDMSELLHTSVGALKASYHFAVKKIEDFFNSHD